MTLSHPLLVRIPIAVASVLGPFAVAPFVAGFGGEAEAQAAWFGALPVLPGLLAARLTGAEDLDVWLVAGAATLGWVLLVVLLTRRSYGAALISLLFAAALAAWTIQGFEG